MKLVVNNKNKTQAKRNKTMLSVWLEEELDRIGLLLDVLVYIDDENNHKITVKPIYNNGLERSIAVFIIKQIKKRLLTRDKKGYTVFKQEFN